MRDREREGEDTNSRKGKDQKTRKLGRRENGRKSTGIVKG